MMAELWERISAILVDVLTMAAISALVLPGVAVFLPGAQRSIPYILGMFVLGIVAGVTAHLAPFLPPWTEWLAVLTGAVCGPTTVAKMQGKTVTEAIAEMRTMRRDGGGGNV